MRFRRFAIAPAAVLGAMTLTGFAVTVAGGASPAGATSCCTVTVNGPAVTMKVTTPGKSAKRTFHGAAGQRVSAVITNPVTSDDGCQTVTLIDPGGAPVTSGSSCGNGNPAGLGPVLLTVPGTYRVRLEADTVATATSKLWISAPVTLGTVTVNGPAVAMNVTRVGQGVQRTFHGTRGHQISAVIRNPVTSDDGCETLTLIDPGGAPAGSGSSCGNGNPVGLGPVTLSSTGSYKVRFEVDTTATAQASLKVSS